MHFGRPTLIIEGKLELPFLDLFFLCGGLEIVHNSLTIFESKATISFFESKATIVFLSRRRVETGSSATMPP